MDDLICETCGVKFSFYQMKGRPIPRFCSYRCRGHTGFKPGGEVRLANLSEEEKFDRYKASFDKNVIRKEGCWDWKGAVAKGGYPVMSCKKILGPDRGHRASWIIHKGPIPEGKCVCHHCDNPICTNPEHLWIGTSKENNDDKVKKCRQSMLPPPHKVGSENGASKLKEEQIKEIRLLLEKCETSREIGRQYGVSKTTILRIKNGTHWKHVKD